LSVITVNWVTSDPVPAVVGTATIGNAGLSLLRGALYSAIAPPLTARSASALAVSIGLPPPKPTSTSASCAVTAARPAASESVVGSGTVPDHTAALRPASANVCTSSSAAPLPARKESVTTSGRRPPTSATRAPALWRAPAPIRIRLGWATVEIMRPSPRENRQSTRKEQQAGKGRRSEKPHRRPRADQAPFCSVYRVWVSGRNDRTGPLPA